MKFRIVLLAILTALSLTACRDEAGDPTQDDIDLDQFPTTPHGTSIIDNMDPALPGTWILVECYIHNPRLPLPYPFAGRTLTIGENGQFTEDYSTEFCRNDSVRSQYEVSGRSGGILKLALEINFDAEDNPDATEGDFSIPTLVMRRNPRIGPKPLIKSRGMEITNNTTHPLGAGRLYDLADGEQWVKYDYSMTYDPDLDTWPKLTLTTTAGATVTWVFRRENTPEFAPSVALPAGMASNLFGPAQIAGLPEQKPDPPELTGQQFTIMVTRPGSPPATMKVTEATTVGAVANFAGGALGLSGQEFELRIAGKKLDSSSTLAELGFTFPGNNFPGPVGNILVRVKN